jgi:hypothetical protein
MRDIPSSKACAKAYNCERQINGLLAVATAWLPITLDTGWALLGGYAPPSWRITLDGNLQLTGIANWGSNATANKNLNNAHPLVNNPQTKKVYRAQDALTGRGAIQIDSSGVITMLASASFPAMYCEIDGLITLTL